MTETIAQLQTTAMLLIPELILLATVCVLFLAGPMLVSDTGQAPAGLRNQWGFLSVAALAMAWMIWYTAGRDVDQGALFRIDDLVWYTRGLSLTSGIILAFILWNQIDDAHAAEAHACLLAIVGGTNLVAAADDLVSLFLALELVSIPTYVLLYLPRRDRCGREATVKYFLLSAFSSALVLYGMSWLYGISGSTDFGAIAAALHGASAESSNLMPRVAMAFLVAGLSFRIAAVPFHFYAPDVFQGTNNSNAAMLSFIPKVVGFVALLRVLPLLPGVENATAWLPEPSLQLLLASMAILTMFVGNFMAWRQTNVYRLMAYSSVAHAGYMLIGLAVGDVGRVPGIDATLFYLAGYGLMTVGVFALLAGVPSERGARSTEHGAESNEHDLDSSRLAPRSSHESPGSTLDSLRGLNRTQPTTAVLLAICLLSLTGLPPTVGFFGKLNLFLAAWGDDLAIEFTLGRTLAVLLALNAAIAAYYYLRIVALMFLDAAPEETTPAPKPPWSSALAGALCTAGTVLYFLQPQWLWDILP